MEEDIRVCDACGKKMNEGYCIDDGLEYFCSDECLHSAFTVEEYSQAYEEDRAYWTQWQ